MNSLLFDIEEYLNENPEEELETVVETLSEFNYYYNYCCCCCCDKYV